MNDDPLDTFDDEQPQVTADGRPRQEHGEGEALVKIVLTEEQLAAACDMLPTEGAPAEDGSEDRIVPSASILEYADDYQSLAALVPSRAVMMPAQPAIQRGSPSVSGPRIAMLSATLFVTLVIVVIGGRTLVEQFAAAPPAEVSTARPSSSIPAAAASTPTPPAAGPSTPTPGAVPVSSPTPVRAAVSTPTPTVTAPSTPTPFAAAANSPTPTAAAASRPPTATTRIARTPTPPQLARRTPTPTAPTARTPTPPQLARRTPAPTVAAARTPSPAATTGRTPIPQAAATTLAASTPEPPIVDVITPATPAATAGISTPAPVTPVSPPATSPVVLPPSVPSAPTLPPDTRAVLLTLYHYQEAFSALDSNAAHAVWPSVDVKALDRAFDQLEQQTFNLQGCNVTVSGTRADASCTGSASYARKVGNRAVHEEPRQWRFTLQQRAGQWLIDRVDAR